MTPDEIVDRMSLWAVIHPAERAMWVELIEATASEIRRERNAAQARADRLQAALHVPGSWACPVCGFVLNKRIIHAESGSIDVNDQDESELCPNDGATTRRVTWEEEATFANKAGIEEMQRADRLEAEAAYLRGCLDTLQQHHCSGLCEPEDHARVMSRVNRALAHDAGHSLERLRKLEALARGIVAAGHHRGWNEWKEAAEDALR